MKKEFGKEYYMVVDLNGKLPGDDLEDCLKVTCTNKSALSRVTGIGRHRLVYLFKKKRISYLVEGGWMILKSSTVMKGSQPGGLKNGNLLKRGNDY